MDDTSRPGSPATGEPDEIGDPVCWLDRLCPDCGAMPSPGDPSGDDGGSPQRCWRCGAAVTS